MPAQVRKQGSLLFWATLVVTASLSACSSERRHDRGDAGAAGRAGASGTSSGVAGRSGNAGAGGSANTDTRGNAGAGGLAGTGTAGVAGASASSTYEIRVSAPPPLDLLFVVDNSEGMEEEQANLAESFPVLLEGLQALPGGPLDLHVGVVDSDVGAGNIVCGRSMPAGDWALLWGNPDDDYSQFANVTLRRQSPSANGCGLDKGARWIGDDGKQRNYVGDISDVFGCIAKVGTQGCNFEHQLRAVEVALTGQPDNMGFLREDARLAIILVTDEDDCSAEQQTDMFGIPGLDNEVKSLRCAARGHICEGASIPYYDVDQGFNPPDPKAQIGFQTDFKDCAPSSDRNLPLIEVERFIDRIMRVKELPDEQILVAGIFGWPLPGTEETAQYRIGKDPDPVAESMKDLWDYLPICASQSFGKAYGGLRLKGFVDAFRGQTFSICQGDMSDAMGKIGSAIATMMTPGCLPPRLVDSDGDPGNGLQPQCTALYRVENRGVTGYDESSLPQCSGTSPLPCWRIEENVSTCPATGRRFVIDQALDSSADAQVKPWHALVKCQACTDASDTKLCPRL